MDVESVGRPGTPSLLRAINDRTALRLLAERGPLSRTQIGALAGLSKPTASQLMDRLEAAGLVEPVPDGEPGPAGLAGPGESNPAARPDENPPLEQRPHVIQGTQGTQGVQGAQGTQGTPGRVARLYRLRGAAAFVAGLDVSGARIEARVCDLTGRMVGSAVLPTPGRIATSALDRVREALTLATADAGIELSALRHVVIGIGGALDPVTGRLGFARHLPGWHEPDLLRRLRTELTPPHQAHPRVDVENDVNLAAVAEQAIGVAAPGDGPAHPGADIDQYTNFPVAIKPPARTAHAVPATGTTDTHPDSRPRPVRDFVVVWIAEGIGAAVIIDGKLHRGATGGAGEVGYMPMPGAPLVRTIGRGTTGGFQSVAGAPAVVKLARRHGVPGSEAHSVVARAVSLVTDRPEHPAPSSAELTAAPGAKHTTGATSDADPMSVRRDGARRMLAELADRLAAGLAPIVAVLDPELIVLTGAVLRAGGEPLRGQIADALHGMAIPRPRLVVSAVADNPVLAGAIHAALAATREAVFSGTVPPAA